LHEVGGGSNNGSSSSNEKKKKKFVSKRQREPRLKGISADHERSLVSIKTPNSLLL
jgi:hypothetical protein